MSILWNVMKLGAYGEKFRFQFSSFWNLILYCSIFIGMGILSLLFNPLILFGWILTIIVCVILLIMFSKILLFYDDGFVVWVCSTN